MTLLTPALRPPAAPPPALQFSLQARQSVTPQPFWMAYARAEKDWDVSAYIHQHTLYEHGHTWAWCGGGARGGRGVGGGVGFIGL